MRKWILEHPEASICTSEGVNQFSNIAIFQDYHGLPEFRQVSVSSTTTISLLVDLISMVFNFINAFSNSLSGCSEIYGEDKR